LPRDILSALYSTASQQEKQHSYYYSTHIIEPRHYPILHRREIGTCQLYPKLGAKINLQRIKEEAGSRRVQFLLLTEEVNKTLDYSCLLFHNNSGQKI
jgi:hypothetical protein